MAGRDLATWFHEVQLRDVVEAIRDGRPPAVTGRDGRATVALMAAIDEASRTGGRVRLARRGPRRLPGRRRIARSPDRDPARRPVPPAERERAGLAGQPAGGADRADGGDRPRQRREHDDPPPLLALGHPRRHAVALPAGRAGRLAAPDRDVHVRRAAADRGPGGRAAPDHAGRAGAARIGGRRRRPAADPDRLGRHAGRGSRALRGRRPAARPGCRRVAARRASAPARDRDGRDLDRGALGPRPIGRRRTTP